MIHGEISKDKKIINRIWTEIIIKIAIKKGESVGDINRKMNEKAIGNAGSGMAIVTGKEGSVRNVEVMANPAAIVIRRTTGSKGTGTLTVIDGKTGIRKAGIIAEREGSITGASAIPEVIEPVEVRMKSPDIKGTGEIDVLTGQMITGERAGVITGRKEQAMKKGRHEIIIVKNGATEISRSRNVAVITGKEMMGTGNISGNSTGITDMTGKVKLAIRRKKSYGKSIIVRKRFWRTV